MPQMAPMNWIILYFIFFSILILMSIFHYFMFLYYPKMKTMKYKKSMTNWKW